MIHAYNELYLNDAKENLASFFDYGINDCKVSTDLMATLFINSGIAKEFEKGNPYYISGMSGVEMARLVLNKTYKEDNFPNEIIKEGYSKEYWAGYVLAEYQWYTCRNFKDIFIRIPFSRIIQMYPVYHEMDISSFIERMEELYSRNSDCNLRRIREYNSLSQSELAKKSGVNLRNIQMYEQRVNNIDKAQANILFKLARALNCNIDDLLENPAM